MINNQTIKRLEKRLEDIKPKVTKRAICEEIGGQFYYGEKVYKTTNELKEQEGIKGRLIILDN
jgi:hypothetical protein